MSIGLKNILRNILMQKFDIYWVKWKYEDNPNLLIVRPDLVLSATNRNIIPLAKITTTGPRV